MMTRKHFRYLFHWTSIRHAELSDERKWSLYSRLHEIKVDGGYSCGQALEAAQTDLDVMGV